MKGVFVTVAVLWTLGYVAVVLRIEARPQPLTPVQRDELATADSERNAADERRDPEERREEEALLDALPDTESVVDRGSEQAPFAAAAPDLRASLGGTGQ